MFCFLPCKYTFITTLRVRFTLRILASSKSVAGRKLDTLLFPPFPSAPFLHCCEALKTCVGTPSPHQAFACRARPQPHEQPSLELSVPAGLLFSPSQEIRPMEDTCPVALFVALLGEATVQQGIPGVSPSF
jgi:hypothetical protein